MKKIYLAKYAQSRFGNLGNVTVEQMIREAANSSSTGRSWGDRPRRGDGACSRRSCRTRCFWPARGDGPGVHEQADQGRGQRVRSGGLAVLDCATAVLAEQTHIGARGRHREDAPARGQARLEEDRRGARHGGAPGGQVPAVHVPDAFALIMDRY